jgi:hypothetical protein
LNGITTCGGKGNVTLPKVLIGKGKPPGGGKGNVTLPKVLIGKGKPPGGGKRKGNGNA